MTFLIAAAGLFAPSRESDPSAMAAYPTRGCIVPATAGSRASRTRYGNAGKSQRLKAPVDEEAGVTAN
ncbi:hypothetical protein EAM_0544 [Erwinia amylovora ATCC 49946]|nr:hypothetical protein EAM_0544 [Erwinia amylovora ATCC 49946]